MIALQNITKTVRLSLTHKTMIVLFPYQEKHKPCSKRLLCIPLFTLINSVRLTTFPEADCESKSLRLCFLFATMSSISIKRPSYLIQVIGSFVCGAYSSAWCFLLRKMYACVMPLLFCIDMLKKKWKSIKRQTLNVSFCV